MSGIVLPDWTATYMQLALSFYLLNNTTMKTIKIVFAMLFAFVSMMSANAQSDKLERTIGIKTQTIKVYGECDMCKKKIENAAIRVDGIKSAIWDEDTKKLIIKYSVFKKDAPENVQRAIASVGYDTEKITATNNSYNALPDCCRYTRK